MVQQEEKHKENKKIHEEKEVYRPLSLKILKTVFREQACLSNLPMFGCQGYPRPSISPSFQARRPPLKVVEGDRRKPNGGGGGEKGGGRRIASASTNLGLPHRTGRSAGGLQDV